MKGKARLLMVLAALSPLCLSARGIADIIRGLEEMPRYQSHVDYSVTLPNKDQDVVYHLELASIATPADTLSPCAYSIGWTLDTPSGPVDGWTSYFDGNLYAFRNNRLKEYHTTWDAAPFRTVSQGRRKAPGVHRSAQFATLIPAYMAAELRDMLADTLYTVSEPRQSAIDGRDALRIDAAMDMAGERVQERNYYLDPTTLEPIRIDIESNPASITEQTITIRFSPAADGAYAAPLTEDDLVAIHPEEFEKYRESNFRIENIVGTPLPTFSLPTSTGERYTHHRGDAFRSPTVIVMLDPATSFTADVVKAVREGVSTSPVSADIIWALTTSNIDSAEEAVGALQPGEHLLIKARSLARDCGAASLPVTVVADAGAVAKKVVLGFNPELATIVLQSIALTE